MHHSRHTHSYGPKGSAIIQSTIYRLFGVNATSDAIRPLSFTLFAACVLVPFVAACLIAEDLDLPVDDALPIMYTSSAIGNGMNPLDDDDEELEGIIQENYRLARREELGIAVRTCLSYVSLPSHIPRGIVLRTNSQCRRLGQRHAHCQGCLRYAVITLMPYIDALLHRSRDLRSRKHARCSLYQIRHMFDLLDFTLA